MSGLETMGFNPSDEEIDQSFDALQKTEEDLPLIKDDELEEIRVEAQPVNLEPAEVGAEEIKIDTINPDDPKEVRALAEILFERIREHQELWQSLRPKTGDMQSPEDIFLLIMDDEAMGLIRELAKQIKAKEINRSGAEGKIIKMFSDKIKEEGKFAYVSSGLEGDLLSVDLSSEAGQTLLKKYVLKIIGRKDLQKEAVAFFTAKGYESARKLGALKDVSAFELGLEDYIERWFIDSKDGSFRKTVESVKNGFLSKEFADSLLQEMLIKKIKKAMTPSELREAA